MTYSEIKITFNQEIPIDGRVSFVIQERSAFVLTVYERWVLFRSGSNQVTASWHALDGEQSAAFFLDSFNLDYNSSGVYETERTGRQVTIKATDPFIAFSNGFAILQSLERFHPPLNVNLEHQPSLNVNLEHQPSLDVNLEHQPPLDVNFEINNFDASSLFKITDVSFSQATNPCTHIRVSVTTSKLASVVTRPVSTNTNSDNPFSFDFLREAIIHIECRSIDNQKAIRHVYLPVILSAGNLNLTVNNSPSGATVSATLSRDYGLDIQYSLDNTNWQNSNTFDSLGNDNYTLYAKDQYGCSVTKTFVVDGYKTQSPYFLISKSNSLRFSNRIIWDNCRNQKNDENTLSCESNVPLPKSETQRFQSCDIITTQFRSNYDNISVFVLKDSGDEDPLLIEQKTNNMRLSDMRDASIYILGNGKTGLYFLSGNTYNYTTGINTGKDYVLNGALPEWAIIGNYIRLLWAWLVIEDIIYDESRNAEVIVVTQNYFEGDTIIQVASIFNRFDYEVYEFSVDMADYLNQNIQIRINNNNDSVPDLVCISERINVKEKQENTVEIIYRNDTNTEVFYTTGIEHKLRLLINKINGKVEDNSETYKTDTTSLLLGAEIYELDEFIFEPLTKELMRKLVQALSHKTVFIDGVGYVKSDSIEVEGALEDSNLYVVKATMIKTNNVYSNNRTTVDTIGLSDEIIEVPNLIEGEDNEFIQA